MKIRIIAKPNQNGEVLWEDQSKVFTPVEIICQIDGKALRLFQKDWNQFISRLLTSSADLIEVKEKLLKKSISLEQIVFGNKTLPWKNPNFKEEIFLQTDPEFTAYPWEILTTNSDFFFERRNFYRGIRSNSHITEKGEAKNFLLIENPVLENLTDSVKKEGKKISDLLEDHSSIPCKRLKQDQFRLTRFWDEISSAAYLHYAGHSEKGGIPIPLENILLCEEIGRAKLPNLKIVFLNSCHSAFEGENTSGLATQFLKSGAQFVLGFLTPIETEIADKIGTEFWQSYLKYKNPRKAFYNVKNKLQLGNASEYASSIAFVCFSPEEKQKSRNWVLTLIFCILLLGLLFLFHWQKENEKKDINIDPSVLNRANEKTKTKLSERQNSLTNRISKIQDANFKKEIYEFLKEENPLLTKSEKYKIVEDVLSTDETETLKFYHFKQLSGIQ